MASIFQKYVNGVQPVTGLAEAGANIGKSYAQGISKLGEVIGAGLQAYGENQQRSEAADAKIASGIARFKQISDIYAQDPEFAPVVAGYAERMSQYQKAPSESLAKKLQAANDIDVMVADLGQTLQAQQLVRGRQIERVGTEALDKFKDVTKVTDPALIQANVLKFKTGDNYDNNEGAFITGLNAFRSQAEAAGKKIQGTDAEAIDSYRRNVTDSVNKAMTAGTLDKATGQRIIEQVEAARKLDRQSQAAKEALPDFGMTAAPRSSKAGYDIVQGTAYQPDAGKPESVSNNPKADAIAKLSEIAVAERKKPMELKKELNTLGSKILDDVNNSFLLRIANGENVTPMDIGKAITGADIESNPTTSSVMVGPYGGFVGSRPMSLPSQYTPARSSFDAAVKKLGIKYDQPITADQMLSINKLVTEGVAKMSNTAEKTKAEIEATTSKTIKEESVKKAEKTEESVSPAPVVGLGKQSVGMVEYERKMSVAEKKSKVANFMTARIGVTDPATGKKVLPAGFNAWFSKAVPESEARVVNVDGIQLLWDGQKFTQIQAAKAPTMKEIRENMIGVYGRQDESGRLVPSEFIPESGVYLGGLFTGTDAADTKFREDMGNLIDARGSVKRLQAINDKFGESLNLSDAGVAEVDVMNLKAALRRDIVGVGQVSNYEQTLIDRVIANPTDFLQLEPKARAILLALAERIDRKIANNAAQYGLTAEIRGTEGGSRYQSLRQKYLAEKLK